MDNAKTDVIVIKPPSKETGNITGRPAELLSVQVWTGTENAGYDPYNHAGDAAGVAPVDTDAADTAKSG